ncbi:MAG: N-acetyltransferase [Actinomycetota bacterium]|nr:N-acetyltransferase [Actinomycetota bacterium]
MRIRLEASADFKAIGLVVEAAFGGSDVARLVERIRASEEFVPELAFVAEEDGEVVGHTMLSYSTVEGVDRPVLQLSPLAVRPDRQGAGIGSSLVRFALRRADERGEPVVLVLGSPAYYPRFGFRPASQLGLAAPDQGFPEDDFMAVPLSAYDPSIRGRVAFGSAFDES